MHVLLDRELPVHIPSEAYAAVAPRWAIWNPCVGTINKENVTQESEEDMMGLLEKRPSVKAIFVGHDHGLDWFCPCKNMWLCYVRLTGYGGYGNCASRTHLASNLGYLMENGDVHSEVNLNG